MLRSLKELTGYRINAQDGDVGKVADFYFDDETWTVRYLVVETGGFLSRHRVLISPLSVNRVRLGEKSLDLHLTKQQVEHSPDIDLDKPVSRQMETSFYDYYGYPYYWASPAASWGMGVYPIMAPAFPPVSPKPPVDGVRGEARQTHVSPNNSLTSDLENMTRESGDPHLRSFSEVKGYRIHALDGEFGALQDLIVDDETWWFCYGVVDMARWLPGKTVLILPRWIEQVSWQEKAVYVRQTKEAIGQAPNFDANIPVTREYETQFFGVFNETPYWDLPGDDSRRVG